jgi:hypothetical protein
MNAAANCDNQNTHLKFYLQKKIGHSGKTEEGNSGI